MTTPEEEKPITQEEFDNALHELVNASTAEQLFTIPGVYEIVAEELNNDVIALVRKRRASDGG